MTYNVVCLFTKVWQVNGCLKMLGKYVALPVRLKLLFYISVISTRSIGMGLHDLTPFLICSWFHTRFFVHAGSYKKPQHFSLLTDQFEHFYMSDLFFF